MIFKNLASDLLQVRRCFPLKGFKLPCNLFLTELNLLGVGLYSAFGNFLFNRGNHPIVPELRGLGPPELQQLEAEVVADVGLGAEGELVLHLVQAEAALVPQQRLREHRGEQPGLAAHRAQTGQQVRVTRVIGVWGCRERCTMQLNPIP